MPTPDRTKLNFQGAIQNPLSQVDCFSFSPPAFFSLHVFIHTAVEPSRAVGVNSLDYSSDGHNDRISLEKLRGGGAFYHSANEKQGWFV